MLIYDSVYNLQHLYILILAIALFLVIRKFLPEKITVASREIGREWILVSTFVLVYTAIVCGVIHYSARTTTTGILESLFQCSGKGAHSSFEVVTENGVRTPVHSDYIGDRLQNNVFVTVQTIPYNHAVINLDVLTGDNAGWHLKENGGLTQCYIFFGCACFVALVGWFQAKPPTDTSTAVSNTP